MSLGFSGRNHRQIFNCLNEKGWPIGQPSEFSFGGFQLETSGKN